MQKIDKQKVTFNDIREASANELKRFYKLDDRELDKQIRSHLDGSNAAQRREIYNEVYRRK